MLFIAGDGDSQGTAAGEIRFADEAQSMADVAAGEVEILNRRLRGAQP
jgi:hypothetical protein